MIANTAKIYANVKVGENAIIEDFCIIGLSSTGQNEETIIGNNAIIRAHSIIYAGNIIGNNFQSGNKVNIREFNEIGDNVSIGTHSVIEHHIKIGNNVRIHSLVFIPEYTILEDFCWIGPQVTITNAKYPKSPDVKNELKGAVIKRHAKIGANVTILPGIIVGENSLTGAGSVITKNIEPNSIYAGNPAKFIRTIHY